VKAKDFTQQACLVNNHNIRHLKGHFFGVWSNSVVKGTEFLRFGLTIRHILLEE
jgi:hypothetical protein